MLPWEALRRCEGGRSDPVTFRSQGEGVVAEWTDAGIPQSASFEAASGESCPPLSEPLIAAGRNLLAALRDAVATTGTAGRFALDHIRLRGSDGQIAATDSRQLFVQSGLTLPWDDTVLVPPCRLFASRELTGLDDVRIGRSGGWVTIRVGPWTISLQIATDVRFPEIDKIVGDEGRCVATMILDEADAAFLTQTVSRLPGADDINRPVTVDLNGVVAVRGRATNQDTATEIVLTASRRAGDCVRVSTNRRYLARAVELGFRRIGFDGGEGPILCREGDRTYLWATLGSGVAVPSSLPVTRIRSDQPTVSPSNSNHKAQSMNGSNTPSPLEPSPTPDRTESLASILDQAEALQTSLRTALTQTRDLIATLKKRKKQSRLVESTLASLRQLEAVDV